MLMPDAHRKYRRYPPLEDFRVKLPDELKEKLESRPAYDPEIMPDILCVLLLAGSDQDQELGEELLAFLLSSTIPPIME